ncbi:STM4014 family protein [Actinoplanes sp. NEAU-H7]|uniref:STM4014 family protein n=2 Tax=Actinoplanes flavus TaxID=2820290 RepID=A0ABS3UL83_9ACTN|nr:STM4014 family protein [Actinoplanes flavus]
MTDKRRCHALLSAAGIPVPPALHFAPAPPASLAPFAAAITGPTADAAALDPTQTPPARLAPSISALAGSTADAAAIAGSTVGAAAPVHGYEALRAAMRAAGWGRVFVKPAHGSSASGVIALAAAGRRVTAVTSVELSGESIFNNLRVRRYDDESSIRTIVDLLAPDGLHVEQWFPKASLGDRVLDLRVVVIAGRPRHVVVRTSRSPMTNLHLGNARGDVAAVRAAAGERSWAAAMETCVRVAACFPRTLHVGVDLMFRVGWRDHAVAEVNAFGDLLPGVLADGQDTYDAQVAALLDGWPGGLSTASVTGDRVGAACVS